MEFIGWDVIITLVIASYGAILSTYSVWSKRKEQKRELKVLLRYGVVSNSILSHRPSTMLFICALNTGKKTVTLTSMGLILPRKDKNYFTFIRPDSNVSFPHDLLEGKSCDVWTETKKLAENLKQEGFSGKIKLKGYYGDAIGRRYKSKSINFDIDETHAK
jgi:hypothetical protein